MSTWLLALTIHPSLSVSVAAEPQPPPQRAGTPRGPEQHGCRCHSPAQHIHFQPASSSPSAASFHSGATAALSAGLGGTSPSLLHAHPCTQQPPGASLGLEHSPRALPAAHAHAAPNGAPGPDPAAHLGAGTAPQHAGRVSPDPNPKLLFLSLDLSSLKASNA